MGYRRSLPKKAVSLLKQAEDNPSIAITIQYKKALSRPIIETPRVVEWMATSPIHKFEMSTDFHSTQEVRKMGILKLAEGDNGQVELNDDELIRIQEQEAM